MSQDNQGPTRVCFAMDRPKHKAIRLYSLSNDITLQDILSMAVDAWMKAKNVKVEELTK